MRLRTSFALATLALSTTAACIPDRGVPPTLTTYEVEPNDTGATAQDLGEGTEFVVRGQIDTIDASWPDFYRGPAFAEGSTLTASCKVVSGDPGVVTLQISWGGATASLADGCPGTVQTVEASAEDSFTVAVLPSADPVVAPAVYELTITVTPPPSV